jgi:hypothetical protein
MREGRTVHPWSAEAGDAGHRPDRATLADPARPAPLCAQVSLTTEPRLRLVSERFAEVRFQRRLEIHAHARAHPRPPARRVRTDFFS